MHIDQHKLVTATPSAPTEKDRIQDTPVHPHYPPLMQILFNPQVKLFCQRKVTS